MIFNIKTSLEINGLRYKDIRMDISFCDGDKDYYDIISYSFKSWLNMIVVTCEGCACSDTYMDISVFDRKDFKKFLSGLRRQGVGNLLQILRSIPSYRVLKGGKAEDFENCELCLEDGLLSRREVERELRGIGEEKAFFRFENDDHGETRFIGFAVDRDEQAVEFRFEQDGEEFIDSVGFIDIRKKYGFDIRLYQDYFRNDISNE